MLGLRGTCSPEIALARAGRSQQRHCPTELNAHADRRMPLVNDFAVRT
jgi:hypothetical protein